ncbi:D-allose transporter substrate-binding protein [Brevibacillus sp. SYP-B805]|uniref:D-allose transporter substrate-binding protein n=1 Tax=Brevibacillus sp. SYP-B805 TaxID=1578199 RepID=UPI0013EC0438|nr:D-allose transporter substrate-binding protein [Brevibacillus sp. SYP-B805]NGQ96699.1 D-allose transporter substrate-binding protein [Brevibacillus sp. SYP-B805]
MKKNVWLSALLVGALSLAAFGCSQGTNQPGQQDQAAAQAGGQKPKYAMILKTLSNPFWVSMKEGIEKEAAKLGIQVDILAVSSEDDTQGQLKLFEDLLNKDYAGIGVAPLSPVNVIPQIVAANQKGIPVVNIDEKLDMQELKNAGGNVYAFVTTDNVKVGAKGAQYIVDTLGAEGGQVAIIEGKAGNASGEARKQGAEEVFKSAKGIELVASQPADWDRIKALDVTTNLIQRYPELKAIYAANDTMALGALEAVKNANKKILVVGTDGTPEAVESVKKGELAATVAQDPAQIGATSLDKLKEAVDKKVPFSIDAEPETIAVDSQLITK